MPDDRPDGEENDPGRKLMITAIVGIAVLSVLTVVVLIYIAWRAAREEWGGARGPGPDASQIEASRGAPPNGPG